MNSRPKIGYGLVLSSLVIAFLAAKTSVERVEIGRSLRVVEEAMVKIAFLESTCESRAAFAYPDSDDFFEGREQGDGWCRGTAPSLLLTLDPYRSYGFTGHVTAGPGLVFRWHRPIEVSDGQKAVLKLFEHADTEAGSDRLVPRRVVFDTDVRPPLIAAHEIWISTVRTEPMSLGESRRFEGWYAANTENSGSVSPLMTADELRDGVTQVGVANAVLANKAEDVYRTLLARWETQVVKVPVLNVDLRYAYAITALATVALMQMVIYAASLARANVDEFSDLGVRLSPARQMNAAGSTGLARVIVFTDLALVVACIALSLATPMACLLGIAYVRREVGIEGIAFEVVCSIAALSLVVATFVVRKAYEIVALIPDSAFAPVAVMDETN